MYFFIFFLFKVQQRSEKLHHLKGQTNPEMCFQAFKAVYAVSIKSKLCISIYVSNTWYCLISNVI